MHLKTILKKFSDAGEEVEAEKIREYIKNLVKNKHDCIYQERRPTENYQDDGKIAQISLNGQK